MRTSVLQHGPLWHLLVHGARRRGYHSEFGRKEIMLTWDALTIAYSSTGRKGYQIQSGLRQSRLSAMLSRKRTRLVNLRRASLLGLIVTKLAI